MILPTKFLDEPSDIVERRQAERKSLGGAGKMVAEGESLKIVSESGVRRRRFCAFAFLGVLFDLPVVFVVPAVEATSASLAYHRDK